MKKLPCLLGHLNECFIVLTKVLSKANHFLFRYFRNNERSKLTVIFEKLENFIVAAKYIEVVRNDIREKTEKTGVMRHSLMS